MGTISVFSTIQYIRCYVDTGQLAPKDLDFKLPNMSLRGNMSWDGTTYRCPLGDLAARALSAGFLGAVCFNNVYRGIEF